MGGFENYFWCLAIIAAWILLVGDGFRSAGRKPNFRDILRLIRSAYVPKAGRRSFFS